MYGIYLNLFWFHLTDCKCKLLEHTSFYFFFFWWRKEFSCNYLVSSLLIFYNHFSDPLVAFKHNGWCVWEKFTAINSSWSIRNSRSYRLPVSFNSLSSRTECWQKFPCHNSFQVLTFEQYMCLSAITLSIMKGREGLSRPTASQDQRSLLNAGEQQKVSGQMYSISYPTWNQTWTLLYMLLLIQNWSRIPHRHWVN